MVEASPIALGCAARRIGVRRFEWIECAFDWTITGSASREPCSDGGRAVLSERENHGRIVAVRLAGGTDDGHQRDRHHLRGVEGDDRGDRKNTRLNSSHSQISY